MTISGVGFESLLKPDSSAGEQRHPPDEILLGFARALRAAGVAVSHDRSSEFLRAVAELGLGDPRATYWAGRATLCGSPDDLLRFDRVFEAYFDHRSGLPRVQQAHRPDTPPTLTLADAERESEGGDAPPEDDPIRAAASATEILRHRDVATMDAHERRRLAQMFSTITLHPPSRRTARHQRWHRGEVDAGRTLRNTLRRLGEPGEIARRRPARRPRRVVLLIDVSGSMSGYAEALLRLAHRFTITGRHARATVETFTVGTRLTHVTRALHHLDPDRAIAAAGDTVPDWSGGTRLGETLQFFLDRWGKRGVARGAVVVIFSDGWERGSPDLLANQMHRLHRIAHRVIWVNPHRGKEGYQPIQQGIAAALPFCDDFVAGHSLATFQSVSRLIEHGNRDRAIRTEVTSHA